LSISPSGELRELPRRFRNLDLIYEAIGRHNDRRAPIDPGAAEFADWIDREGCGRCDLVFFDGDAWIVEAGSNAAAIVQRLT
jgi:hypothetical protein